MYKNITGILLVGGISSRMGTNKSFLKIGNKYIIEILAELLKNMFGRVILVTNEPGLFGFLQLDTFEDIYKLRGPLAGIHSGLINSVTESNFILSCDMPLVTEQIIRFIADYPSDKKIKVPFADGFVQQLCGFYSIKTLPEIEHILGQVQLPYSKCNVLKLIEELQGEVIDIESKMLGYDKNSFLNMNDMAQYKLAEQIYSDRIKSAGQV